ncbi:MAG: hypothetical protein ACKPJJ_10630, partial [Planctomycetaceae bacterium]
MPSVPAEICSRLAAEMAAATVMSSAAVRVTISGSIAASTFRVPPEASVILPAAETLLCTITSAAEVRFREPAAE